MTLTVLKSRLIQGLFLLTLVGLTAAATFFSSNAPIISIGIIVVALIAVFFIVSAHMPGPGEKLESLVFVQLCIYTFLLIAWPRYAFIRISDLPGVSPPRVIQLSLLVTWIYVFSKSVEFRKNLNQHLNKFRPMVYCVFLIFLFKIASIFLSSSAVTSTKGVMNEALSVYLLLFIALSCLRSRDDALTLLRVMIGGFLLVAAIGLYEAWVGKNIFLSFFQINSDYLQDVLREKTRGGSYRIQSTFSHPLTFSEFLAIASPISIIVFTDKKSSFLRFLACSILIALAGALIYKTGSRSGFGAYFVVITSSVIFLLIRQIRTTNNHLQSGILLLAVISSIALSVLSLYFLSDTLIGKTTREYNSGMVRLDMWKHGLLLAQDSPIFGYGQDMAAHVLGFSGFGGTITIDSYYLSILLESGFISLFSFLWMMLYLATRSFGFGFQSNENGRIILLLLSSVIGFLTIKSILSLPHSHGLVMIIIGTSLFLMSKDTKSDDKPLNRVKHSYA